jgi:acetyltransferase-like isoleucine patch superfamily enzyme
MINRNSSIQSKGGDISIGKSVAGGANSSRVSWSGIRIDEGTVLAGGCYLSAGKFDYGELGTSILEQEPSSSGPITIGKNSWIATRVTILDGVRIGENSIVAAGAVVTGNLPPRTIASGNPAKVVFERDRPDAIRYRNPLKKYLKIVVSVTLPGILLYKIDWKNIPEYKYIRPADHHRGIHDHGDPVSPSAHTAGKSLAIHG